MVLGDISEALQWVFIIAEAIVILLLSKLVAEFLNRLRLQDRSVKSTKLTTGSKAPLFKEIDHKGYRVSLQENENKNTMLLFAKYPSNSCMNIIDSISKAENLNARILIVTREDEDWSGFSIPSYLSLIQSDTIFTKYLIENTPTAVLIDPGNNILGIQRTDSPNDFIQMLKREKGKSKTVS